jgi:hypothetical protein
MGKRLGRHRARAYGIHGHCMAETAVADDNDHPAGRALRRAPAVTPRPRSASPRAEMIRVIGWLVRIRRGRQPTPKAKTSPSQLGARRRQVRTVPTNRGKPSSSSGPKSGAGRFQQIGSRLSGPRPSRGYLRAGARAGRSSTERFTA